MNETRRYSDDEIIKMSLSDAFSRRKLAEIYRSLSISDETVKLLRKYLKASANLYGVILLEDVYNIIDSQNPGFVSKVDFAKYISAAAHEQEYFVIMTWDMDLYDAGIEAPFDNLLIDINILGDDESDDKLETLMEMQCGKPRYIPEKKEFLRYSTDTYIEPTPQYNDMVGYFTQKLKCDDGTVKDIVGVIVDCIRTIDCTPESTIKLLENFDIGFDSKNDFERFFGLYAELQNNTRMQCNLGHTPNELRLSHDYDQLPSNSIEPAVKQETVRRSEPKVGRNDPCPCGSGKKYKKCCGR